VGHQRLAWLEVWSYMVDLHFYGLVSRTRKGEVCLFVFFETDIVGRDLKSRYGRLSFPKNGILTKI
jgi:Ornithine decarboxylase antizyme